MSHRIGDVFNPPGLTNFLGCLQVDFDLVAVRSVNFPPLACSDTVTGGLYLDGRYFPSTGVPITFRWWPDRIERHAEFNGFEIKTTTVAPIGYEAALVKVEVRNTGQAERHIEMRLALRGGVTRKVGTWNDAFPPVEYEHDVQVDRDRAAVSFSAKKSTAVSLQGVYPRASRVDETSVWLEGSIPPGETLTFFFIDALGMDIAQAGATFDAIASAPDAAINAATKHWNEELEALFTPDNGRYSGHLPRLETIDDDIRKLYWMGALGVAYFKRESPHSVIGRTYDTLMPRYWQSVTFLWDYSLSSVVHALLDPVVMKRHLEHWMTTDIHKCFGTEWLTGAGVGTWYSVNDFAMTRMMRDYLRFTGDHGWLDSDVSGKTPFDYLNTYARNWNGFKTSSGLADYGGIGNLLECVSTYVHEVASLNAANVFNMRATAAVSRMRGDETAASALESDADALAGKVLELYAEGKGFFHARRPNGDLIEVKHCYDLLTILNIMGPDLSEVQKNEMREFFIQELMTPTWMHALSCSDSDAMFSLRPDHQWTGAYPAWPPQTAEGLFRIGESELAFDWIKGLAASANQGPFGQAHFVESFIDPEEGGARKAPPDFPYITDWTCSSNGAWSSLIIEGLFGVDATLDKGLVATPRFGGFDKHARLVGLNYQGTSYEVDVKGARPTT